MKILIIFFGCLIASCAGSNHIADDVRNVRFGSGGGFTGEINGFELSKDGTLSSTSKKDTILLKTIKRKEVGELFKMAGSIREISVNEPSNMYQYIEVDYTSNTKRWVWGKEFNDLPSEIKIFYERLSSLTK